MSLTNIKTSEGEPVVEPRNRLKELMAGLCNLELAGALLVYSRDVFYYTGTAQPSCLAVFPDDYLLFIRSGFEFAVDEVFIGEEKLREERSLEKICKDFFSRVKGTGNKVGMELDIITAEQFRSLEKIFSSCELVNISPTIQNQRKAKDRSEIAIIKRACDAIHKGHEAVVSTLTEGMTELELAAAVENSHRLAGHEGIFFIRQPDFFMSRGPLSSGSNLFKISGVVYTITGVGLSPSVPAGPSRRKISRGDPIIVDIPTLVDGYHADQTRTYCIGEAHEGIRSLYADLRAIADHLISRARPGITCSELYQMAVEKAADLGRTDHFLNFGRGKRSRLLGHGIGLELNEPPIISEHDHTPIPGNCVIALDIHMMQTEVGVVKLEDMILIADEGNEILTKSPRELFEISP
jgi:Xaa-Pro aminopeptidase